MWPIVLAVFLFGLTAYTYLYSSFPIPMPRSTAEKILKLAKVGRKDVVYDLGCGDGRILIQAAKMGAKAVGIENNPLLFWLCKRNVKKSRLQIQLIRGNFFKQDLHQATVVVAYLSQNLNNRLEKKLERELKTGTRIVSADHTFAWKEIKRIKTGHFNTHLYKMGP